MPLHNSAYPENKGQSSNQRFPHSMPACRESACVYPNNKARWIFDK